VESVTNAMSGQPIQTLCRVLDVGGGLDERAKQFYPDAKIVTIDKKTGWDVEKDGLPLATWDVIFCNHIIEHLYDVDKFIENCKGVMSPGTILEIGTPNLCAWFNRLVFLAGYFPHSYEVSKCNVGRIKAWSHEAMGGHIHIFTPRALKQLLELHGLYIISCVGEESTTAGWLSPIDKLLSLNVNLASAFRIQCILQP